MTATPVQTTLEERVLEWTEQLCESLAENYKRYHRRMIEANSVRFNADGKRADLSKYAQDQLEALDNGTAKLMKFRIESGRKYHKIIQQDFDTFRDRNEYREEVFMPLLIRKQVKFIKQQVGSHQQSMYAMI